MKNQTARSKIKIGNKFIYWEVLKVPPSGGIECKCICGRIRKIPLQNLIKQKSRSCGCMNSNVYEQTCIEKYGVTNVNKIEEVKQKKVETSLRNHGTKYPSQSQKIIEKIRKTKERLKSKDPAWEQKRQEKRRKTNLEIHGVEYPAQSLPIQQARKNKSIKIYGVDHSSKLQSTREKNRKTNLEKYGVEYPTQSKKIQDKNRQTRLKNNRLLILSDGSPIADMIKRYNVEHTQAYFVFRTHGEQAFVSYCQNGSNHTSLEILSQNLFAQIIPEIEHYNKKPEQLLVTRRPDFRLENNKKILFINVDGLYMHSERNVPNGYHINLRNLFEANQLTIFQFLEDDIRLRPEIVKSIVAGNLGINQQRIYARKCKIKKLKKSESDAFFVTNHLMGKCNGVESYGLFHEQDLVSVISIRKYRGEKDTIEIARFCSKLSYLIVGGFSKLLKNIEKIHNPKKIVSFCDMRHSTGKSYKVLGFDLEKVTLGWKWTDGHQTYNRLKCRANMDERKLTQMQHAKELGWYKIYDAGQAKFSKHLN